MHRLSSALAGLGLLAATLLAQQGPPPPPPQGPPPGEHMPHPGPPGKWWLDAGIAQRIGITADQQKQIEALFQQNRLKLMDLSTALQREEETMGPLLESDHPDEPRILAQIDRIAQARAELEKANAKFLLGIRAILTLDQWRKLEADRPHPPPHGSHWP